MTKKKEDKGNNSGNNSERDWEGLKESFNGHAPSDVEVKLFDENLYNQARDRLPKNAN